MAKNLKSSLAMLLVLVMTFAMCVAFVPALGVDASAATVDYVYNGKYIYNWGTRGEVATFLSPNAETFYEKHSSYTELSAYAGGTSTSTAPTSQLYNELKSLMTGAHTYITSYNATRDLYKYTDCEANGNVISSFYSGKSIGPAWDSGATWNREHTWPNSKGLGGDDENDIMMLRPTSTSENGARGNKAYGKSSGYYNPNSESNGQYDLRGDVARIFLYVYVRWGNTGAYAWGTGGVMESVDVLLEWMEEDPVDTWELGRNDSVEAITGTRNVFVDYPELGFLLFGAEIPEDMATPSSDGGAKCDHNNFDSGVVFAATCTAGGYTLYTCRTAGCGYSYKGNATPAKDHNYENGTCTVCGEAAVVVPEYVTSPAVGQAYKLGFLHSNGQEYYFTGTMSTSNQYYGATDTAYANGVDMFLEEATGGYRLYFNNGTKQYINIVEKVNAEKTHINFTYSSTATTVFTWDAAKNALATTVSGQICYMGNYGTYTNMGTLQSSKMNASDYIARLYSIGGGSTTPDDTCQHNYTSSVTKATCSNDGYTTYTCSLCNHTYTNNKVAAYGHAYTNGTCIDCGKAKPTGSSVTISFTDTANRTSFSTTQQIWVQNGITVTNNKASASSNVADYSNPVRFYQGSTVIISYPGITKIEIDCSGLDSKYINPWKNVPAGATVTQNGSIITVEFSTPVDTITYTNLTAQARAYSITVYAGQDTSDCTHINTSVIGAVAASCTAVGHTGKTRCDACGDIVSMGNELPITDHTWGEWITSSAPTCTDNGSERRDCTACDAYETADVTAPGHKDDDNDGICDTCDTNLNENSGSGEGSGSAGDDANNKTDNESDSQIPDSGHTIEIMGYMVIIAGIVVAVVFIIKKKKS